MLESCRASRPGKTQEVAMNMHPEIAAQAAAQHVREMQELAARERRAREARRARRG
jgi:hypothetical protein